ncbi:hypothetical protein Tco_1399256 [Tanacetum coccineum]
MAELVRLQICEELDDTWSWVAPKPERQPDAAASALKVAEGAPNIAEGAQRVARLEEEVHGMRGALGEQREIPYVRRTRRRTDDAGTSATQQPDP